MEKFNFNQAYSSISRLLTQEFEGFIPSVVAKSQTAEYCTVIPDVKYSREIPLLDYTAFNFVSSLNPSTFNDTATQSISTVALTAVSIKTENSYDLSTMETYYFGKYMRRGSDQRELPFAEFFVNDLYKRAADKLDVYFWQGSSSPSITGILTTLQTGAIGLTAQSFTVSTTATNGIVATFDNMYNALSSEYVGQELVLFCGMEAVDKYLLSLRNLNFFHQNPNENLVTTVSMFGRPNVKVVGTGGLNGINKAVLVKPEFLFWGTDLTPDAENVQAEYNMYLDKFLTRYKVKLAPGIAFKSKVVIAASANSL
jgi:hypothetical protein